ncbi:MAG: hypothetical protein KJ052_04015 [Candidatus Hydrogenedentes bacterium]|nr:hypothetical protein [Candidatus Hydrogenedentota bacterium]
MAIFRYTAIIGAEAELIEGTVKAASAKEASKKLEKLSFRDIRLKQLSGLNAVLKSLAPTVK